MNLLTVHWNLLCNDTWSTNCTWSEEHLTLVNIAESPSIEYTR